MGGGVDRSVRILCSASADHPMWDEAVPRNHSAMDERSPILLCYDGSAPASHAIEIAAGMLGDRRAVVLAVGPELTLPEALAEASAVVPGNAFDALNDADAMQLATRGVETAREHGFTAEVLTDTASEPWKAIARAADDLRVAAIVVGRRSDADHQVFDDSVPHRLQEHARRPVLIIPANATL